MKVAFVVPFYGPRASGGAEAVVRSTAMRLAQAGVGVDVFTTCVLDLVHDWNVNYHPKGTTVDEGVNVHRFRTDYVDYAPFPGLNERILSGETLSRREEDQFISMHLNSFDLYRALAADSGGYDWMAFAPYLFGTTCYGTRLCRTKKVIIPCLHDEPYAKMRIFSELFGRADRIVYHSYAESQIALRLCGADEGRGIVVGGGIETGFESDAGRFRRKYNLHRPFVLYAGRKDSTKNVDTLVENFSLYRERHPGELALVMMGPGRIPVRAGMEDHVFDLGFVPEQDKRDAYSAAEVFCQPSLNESFSIVIMESWMCRKPCLVHAGCAVTREHVVRSGGGLYFGNYPEFEKCLERLLFDSDLSRRMGDAGRDYVLENFAWGKVVDKYIQLARPR